MSEWRFGVGSPPHLVPTTEGRVPGMCYEWTRDRSRSMWGEGHKNGGHVRAHLEKHRCYCWCIIIGEDDKRWMWQGWALYEDGCPESTVLWVVSRKGQGRVSALEGLCTVLDLQLQLVLPQPSLCRSLLCFLGSTCHQSTQCMLCVLTCPLSAFLNWNVNFPRARICLFSHCHYPARQVTGAQHIMMNQLDAWLSFWTQSVSLFSSQLNNWLQKEK